MPGPTTCPKKLAAAVHDYAVEKLPANHVIKTHQIAYRTLSRGVKEAGYRIRRTGERSGYRGPANPIARIKGDYEPGVLKVPCTRCKERNRRPDNGGLCHTCGKTPVCNCDRPVPLTSRPDTSCRRCGCVILKGAA